MLTATKLRIYPNAKQEESLAKAFGCARWLWNNSLAETQKVYQETGKGLGQFALNKRLPELKKEYETRNKARILVAKAHEHTANARKDWLHKLSRKLVDENQVIATEDLHVKGMMKNHCLAKAIGDVGWGMFTNFLEYKAARAGKGFIKVNRYFPSSKTCSCCMHAQASMPLNIRSWRCDKCGTSHDRDINAAQNIRLEAQRMIAAGIAGTANRGNVSRGKGRKSSVLAVAVEVRSLALKDEVIHLLADV